MGRSDGTLEACDAAADQAGSATLSVTGKRLGGAVTEEIVEPALVPRNFAHFREINELGYPTRKYRLGTSSSSRARLIRRAIKPRSPAERWRRSDYLKDSVVTRKRWQVVPDSSTTSSRHSGLSLSLATVSRIMSEHAVVPSRVIVQQIDAGVLE